ncbi:MAG: polyprenyl synthetase family protein [Candidatus Sumerlaeaceae bacterium]|jgi:geranylgeranyl diphosphate synthase type I
MKTGLLTPELETFFSQAALAVEDYLSQLVAPPEEPIPNLDDALEYALELDEGATGHGKRLRPVLCLLVARQLGGKTEHAMPFAAAIELMHNFCLVHDDLEDGDEYRRGRPAVWKKYGVPHAINIGDYLFTKIFSALLSGLDCLPESTVLRFFALMAATLDHTHRGQAMDINMRDQRITIDQYLKVVREKTGYYLAAPLIAGAFVAEAPQEIEEALNSYGLFIGPLFQIRDDLIDLTQGKGRKEIGSDIREGKRSFMVAYACEHAGKADLDELLRILDLPRELTTPDDIEKAISIFKKCGALQRAEHICEELRTEALKCLTSLPEPLRTSLTTITHYLAGRTK